MSFLGTPPLLSCAKRSQFCIWTSNCLSVKFRSYQRAAAVKKKEIIIIYYYYKSSSGHVLFQSDKCPVSLSVPESYLLEIVEMYKMLTKKYGYVTSGHYISPLTHWVPNPRYLGLTSFFYIMIEDGLPHLVALNGTSTSKGTWKITWSWSMNKRERL